MSRGETPRLDALQAALDRADIDTARRVLVSLDAEEQQLLEQEMGRDAFAQALEAAAGGRRQGKLGKVIVLPGIMGTELDAVDRKGDSDRIWINFVRLIAGRIGELELDPDGSSADKNVHVRTAGVHRKTYLPLIMKLDARWHVRPFGFDWREDIDKSAGLLDAEIKAFGGGDPVHLVAHSMGGLVSRRFIQLFPETWKAMNDSSGRGRGGRLLMVGTPNRGSFAIPLTFSGSEKLVKLLAKADVEHSMQELLSIVTTFPGMYQMLPSGLVDLGDDHKKLFEAASWGGLPISGALLARGDAFLRSLDSVTDHERLLYVAGANLETPARIRITAPGEFSYRETLDGDGRVPHELGLLEGVTTYWVDRGVHGDLVKHAKVLDAVTELLQAGRTSVLPTAKPAKPRAARARGGWVPAERVAPLDPQAEAILARPKLERRAGAPPELTPEEQIRLENLGMAEYLGTGDEPGEATRDEQGARALAADGAVPPAAPGAAAAVPRPKLTIEVVWGDVTKVEADVYTVGHYEGVLPQRAELALDEAVTGVLDTEEYDPRSLVITQHVRRGNLRANVGDVSFFPWGQEDGAGRVVAVSGMGRPGTFDSEGLRRLVHSTAIAVAALPRARKACSVLIGSGEGALPIPLAVRGFIEGIADAADEVAAGGDNVFRVPVERLIVVERDRGRADEILSAFREELRSGAGRERAESVELVVEGGLKRGAGGAVSIEDGIALLADTLVAAAGAATGSAQAKALAALLSETSNKRVRQLALARLQAEAATLRTSGQPRFRVERRTVARRAADIPTRISFWQDEAGIKAAAIDQTATVAERLVRVSGDVVGDLSAKMTDPPPDEADDLSSLFYRLLVPSEFRDVLESGPLVFEVDRAMAQLHWEMLATSNGSGASPLAVQRPLARQLRTTYSPDPTRPRRPGETFRALIVGDPGDPAKGEDLPGARNEAIKVKEILEAHPRVDVDARIGAPSVPREGPLQGVKAADRLEVLSLLVRGDYDLIHYAGHGDFDPAVPDRVGWVFARGLLTPGEISRIDRVPSIVVSNACLSARTSQVLEGEREAQKARTDAELVPSLADEFFKLGVRTYIGTAWEVNDIGAEVFAREFYGALLEGESVGEAVRCARQALWKSKDTYGVLWAAYQHYGDPATEAGLGAEV